MIVRLLGGMCNQMFQYAFGRSVSSVKKEPLFFAPLGLGPGFPRAYSLGAFNVNVNLANDMEEPVYREPSFRYDPNVYNAVPGSFFKGYWQTEKYFDDRIVRKELSLRNPVGPESQRVAENILSWAQRFRSCAPDRLLATADGFASAVIWVWITTIAAMSYVREREPEVKFFIFFGRSRLVSKCLSRRYGRGAQWVGERRSRPIDRARRSLLDEPVQPCCHLQFNFRVVGSLAGRRGGSAASHRGGS